MYRIIHLKTHNFTFVIAFSSNFFRNLLKFWLEYHMNLNLIHFLVSNHIFQPSLVDLNFHYHWNNCRFYLPLFPDPFVRRPRFFGFAGRAVFVPFREDKYPDCRGMILIAGIVEGFCIDWMNALNISRLVFQYVLQLNWIKWKVLWWKVLWPKEFASKRKCDLILTVRLCLLQDLHWIYVLNAE